MKRILLLRHAKSSWKLADLSDHDRPLNKRGIRNAAQMGAVLREAGCLPDLILSSTAVRARETTRLFAEAAGYSGEITHTDHLYLAEARTYITLLRELDDAHQAVLMVGHNPGIEEVVNLLTTAGISMPTAALAHIEAPIERWNELDTATECHLRDLWRPRELSV